jgi:PST family polysaccharide transporter
MLNRLTSQRTANPDVHRAFTNLMWLGLERATQIIVGIIISGILARYFGPTVFGKWQYANTVLLVISPITWVCGAEILVPTIVEKPPSQLGTVLGSAFVLRIGIALLTTLATWAGIAIGVHMGTVDAMVGAMLAGLALTLLLREPFIAVISAWLQAITFNRPQLIVSMATVIAKGALVWLLVRMMLPAAGFGWLWALESAAIAVILMQYYRQQHGGKLHWHLDKPLFNHFARSGTVFWLGLIGMYLFLKLDRLMLERVISFADLGCYSAAQQLNENWISLGLMLAQTIAPAFVYRVQQAAQLRRNLARLFALTTALMIIGAALLDALAGFIIGHVFGPQYAGAISIFRWAVWLSVPAGIEAIGNLVVLKYQAKFVLLVKWVIALVVAFVVNLLAIAHLGAWGALVGLAAGYVAAACVNFYYIRFRLFTS